MARLCERPGCSAPASVAYGFDPQRMLVWLEPLRDGAPGTRSGALCRRHAESLSPPRGWWLDDRREALPRLFPATTGDRDPAPPGAPGDSPRTSRRRRSRDETGELPFPAVEPPGQDAAASTPPPVDDPDGVTVEGDPTPWVPAFDRDDDLDGLLDARGPLLSRAFGARRGHGSRG